MQQALQRVRSAPPEVKRLMEVANCVPPEAELPEFLSSEVYNRLAEASDDATFQAAFEAAAAQFFEQFRSESFKGLLDFIYGTRPETSGEVVSSYMYVCNVRELLRTIASVKKGSTEITLPALGLDAFVQASIDKKGEIRFEVGAILRALEGAEISRIRQCLICKKIFWAGRKDKDACTTEHQNVLRVRRHRENEGENWQEVRRESRNKKWREGYVSGYKRQRLKKRKNLDLIPARKVINDL